ncbi:MAG: outer membrane protein assembly factor BamD [Verrucomicrobiota bacterium]|nr:outer membrane protein assembly factor BamD [Verrucomicrobiota bacterium]
MIRLFCLLFLALATSLVGVPRSAASVVFKPNAKTKYEAPGEEQINGTAQQLFNQAQASEKNGDFRRAIRAYGTIYRRYPKDALAAGAAYRRAQLQEQVHDFLKAAETYRVIVEKYPKFERFDDAIESQFRIGELYLNGKKERFLGVSVVNALDRSVDIFAAIVRTAPFGKYTARAQFDIGLAREKQGNNDAAIQAYQAVVDKFPSDPVSADAQYQIGYIWFRAARAGTKDASAAGKAKTGFEDFLFRHPSSEKSMQAREDLKLLEQKQTANAFEVAKFYDKQKNYRAAVIYYNDVVRQQPGSRQGNYAKTRVDQLRAKYGEANLQPAVAAGAPSSRKTKRGETASAPTGNSSSSQAPMRGSSTYVPPLPPADADVSLPPPASLSPDTTTAPPSSAPDASPTPEPSASPES